MSEICTREAFVGNESPRWLSVKRRRRSACRWRRIGLRASRPALPVTSMASDAPGRAILAGLDTLESDIELQYLLTEIPRAFDRTLAAFTKSRNGKGNGCARENRTARRTI